MIRFKFGIPEIAVRNLELYTGAVLTATLHYLQAELLHRDRNFPDDRLEKALMVTMAGISAGMQNTG